MTNPTPHGQVPEALIDLIDAYTETRHRCCGIYNARTEAARKAVIAALRGVQALSAAPAGWKLVPVNPTPEMWKAAKSVPDPNPPYAPHYGLVWDAMLAASPTPTAEQLSANKTAAGEQNAVSAEWLEQAYREGWAACRDAETIGEEAEDWAFGNSTANSRMIDAQQAAPQPAPESIRSILIRCREVIDTTKVPAYPAGADLADEIDVLLAAQPAPAPLSDDAKDAARYRWLRATTNFATNSQGERIDVRNQPDKWDAVIDAALAAQGGKDA